MSDPTPKPTGRYRFTNPCRWCRGTGCVPASLNGWFVGHQDRDGFETEGPFRSEADAVAAFLRYRGMPLSVTLIGPDGQEYTLEEP